MLSSGLRNWQQSNNFRVADDTVYGVHDNVGFSVAEEDGGKLFVFMLSGKDTAFDSLEDLLMSQSDELHLAQVGDVESYLALFFDEADGGISPQGMTALLDFVAGNYRTCGFRAPNVCIKCGAPATKRSFINGMVQPLCAPCREADKLETAHSAASPAASDRVPDARRQTRGEDAYDDYGRQPARREANDDRRPDRREEEYSGRRGAPDYGYPPERPQAARGWDEHEEGAIGDEGNAPSGFFGALLGAVAGLAPYVLSATLGFELAALCFLSGIGAIIGYVSFGGLRQKKNALVTTIALSEMIALGSVMLVAGASNMQNGFSTMMSNLFSLAWLNMLMAAIGALLGVMVSLDRLHKYLLSSR